MNWKHLQLLHCVSQQPYKIGKRTVNNQERLQSIQPQKSRCQAQYKHQNKQAKKQKNTMRLLAYTASNGS
jgi:membrane protein insertase Oxa1/YidC/SpoIIIJ